MGISIFNIILNKFKVDLDLNVVYKSKRSINLGPTERSFTMCKVETNECRCPCHEGVLVEHFQSCCLPCPFCELNIPMLFYGDHYEKCGQE